MRIEENGNDLSNTQYVLVAIICVIIVVGGVLLNKYLKEIDVIDSYSDHLVDVRDKIDDMDCDRLFYYGWKKSSLYNPAPEQQTYAKQVAKEKCSSNEITDEEWGLPAPRIREHVPTMDELYDQWEKKP